MPNSPISNPMALVRAVELLIKVFSRVNIIVSRGDDFTPVARMQPFQVRFLETNETMVLSYNLQAWKQVNL